MILIFDVFANEDARYKCYYTNRSNGDIEFFRFFRHKPDVAKVRSSAILCKIHHEFVRKLEIILLRYTNKSRDIFIQL